MQNFQKYNTTRTVRRKEAQLSIQKNAYILRSGREEKVFFFKYTCLGFTHNLLNSNPHFFF